MKQLILFLEFFVNQKKITARPVHAKMTPPTTDAIRAAWRAMHAHAGGAPLLGHDCRAFSCVLQPLFALHDTRTRGYAFFARRKDLQPNQRAHTEIVPNAYVCTRTGNVHLCGVQHCDFFEVNADRQHVCKFTGVSFGPVMQHDGLTEWLLDHTEFKGEHRVRSDLLEHTSQLTQHDAGANAVATPQQTALALPDHGHADAFATAACHARQFLRTTQYGSLTICMFFHNTALSTLLRFFSNENSARAERDARATRLDKKRRLAASTLRRGTGVLTEVVDTLRAIRTHSLNVLHGKSCI